MGIAQSWNAVIDSLSAGYRFLGRHIELIAIPVLLDIWLWLGPRLSITPLVEGFVRYYETMAGMQDMPTMPAEMTPQILLEFSQEFNLMDALVSSTLLHVPSLLASVGPVSDGRVLEMTGVLEATSSFLGLSVVSLFIGVLYMNLLAWRLPLGEGTKPTSVSMLLKLAVRHYIMVLLFVIAMAVLLFVGLIPVVFGSVLLSLLLPALSSILVTLYIGMMFVVLFYLYFVTAAIILDGKPLYQAVLQSVVVVRSNFLATLLFILLTWVISVGMSLLMDPLTQFAPIGIAIAIPVNAYIGSGIVLALLVFYRTRVLRLSAVPEHAGTSDRLDRRGRGE